MEKNVNTKSAYLEWNFGNLDFLSEEQFSGAYQKDMSLFTLLIYNRRYAEADGELQRLSNVNNLAAKTYILMRDYFSEIKKFEEIKYELASISNAGYEFAGMIVRVYESIESGNRIPTKEQHAVAITTIERAILLYIENKKIALAWGNNLVVYKFFGVKLDSYHEDIIEIEYVRLNVKHGNIRAARSCCCDLANSGNPIACAYILIIDYFEKNKYKPGLLPEHCKKEIIIPADWKEECKMIAEKGYSYIELLCNAAIYKEWKDFTCVGKNEEYFLDLAYAALRLILTGEVYYMDGNNVVEFFGAQEYPHRKIEQDDFSMERMIKYYQVL